MKKLRPKAVCSINQELGRQRDKDPGKVGPMCRMNSGPTRAVLRNSVKTKQNWIRYAWPGEFILESERI